MIRIDSGQVVSVARQMQAAPADLRPRLRKSVRAGAELVAGEARRNASWSSRIPGAIRTRVGFGARTAGAQVVVDSGAAPHARPFEGFSISRGGAAPSRGASFRHPVFGGDTWVDQPARPFLMPASRAKQPEALREIQKAINETLGRIG